MADYHSLDRRNRMNLIRSFVAVLVFCGMNAAMVWSARNAQACCGWSIEVVTDNDFIGLCRVLEITVVNGYCPANYYNEDGTSVPDPDMPSFACGFTVEVLDADYLLYNPRSSVRIIGAVETPMLWNDPLPFLEWPGEPRGVADPVWDEFYGWLAPGQPGYIPSYCPWVPDGFRLMSSSAYDRFGVPLTPYSPRVGWWSMVPWRFYVVGWSVHPEEPTYIRICNNCRDIHNQPTLCRMVQVGGTEVSDISNVFLPFSVTCGGYPGELGIHSVNYTGQRVAARPAA